MKMNAESVIRFLLIGISLVAIATGLNIIVQGVSGIPQPDITIQASVDNELRFMTIFWIAFGLYCFSISKKVTESKRNILYIALVFFFSGLARLLSYFTIGEPIPLFVGAMIVELTFPFILLVLLKQMENNEAINRPQ